MSGELAKVANAIDAMAQCLAQVDTGDTWGGFTCAEIEAIADVLRVGGHDDVATFIVSEHARDDEDGDEHYQGAPS